MTVLGQSVIEIGLMDACHTAVSSSIGGRFTLAVALSPPKFPGLDADQLVAMD